MWYVMWYHIMIMWPFRFLPVEQKEYRGTGSNFDGKDASTLGERVSITVNFENAGPSHIIGGQLDIYLPSNGSETGKYYYYYPGAIVHVSVMYKDCNYYYFILQRGTFPPYIQCDNSTLNPSRYNVTDARVVQQQQSRRRKRRSESLLESTTRISTRQTEPTVVRGREREEEGKQSRQLVTLSLLS